MRVCIIGAGISGLVSIKSCLDEGLEPVCFEKSNDIAGLWRFREEDDGEACVMRTTVMNTSKEVMALSDFPVKADYPNYMHNSMVQKYIRDYAAHFNLLKCIRFRRSIVWAEPRANFEQNGEWNVTVKDEETGEQVAEVFGAIMVCTGHHAKPNMADFPGLSQFQGKVFHARSYRDSAGPEFKGKRVLVVGIGNSGGDIAVDVCRVANQVLLSTRRGTWVFYRIGDFGIPSDLPINRRIWLAIEKRLPKWYLDWSLRREANLKFDHRMYSLEPAHQPTEASPTLNDEIGDRIASGLIKVKTDVEKFTETDVHFKDGSVEKNIDTVYLATGYNFCFPFLPESVVCVKNYHCSLYRLVFPSRDKQHTLAFIGLIQPNGAINPISEGQARWAARVFKGLEKLPTKSEMEEEVARRQASVKAKYVDCPRYSIQVNWVDYMDEIHEQFGARPSLWRTWLTDPRLAYHLTFDPVTPFQYRLVGPHQWKGARDCILGVWDRVMQPLATRPLPKRRDADSTIIGVAFAVSVLVILPAVLLLCLLR